MLTGTRPSALSIRAFDVALVLHADHELNASTFAARVAAATLTDLHSAIVGAIGALKGPLHGGANADVMRLLIEIGEDATPDRVDEAIRSRLARKVKIPGFGHRVYRTEDPRATHLRRMSKDLGERAGNTRWFEMSQRIEQLVTGEKKLYPERRLLLGLDLLHARHSDRSLHADLRGEPRLRLDGALPRAVQEQPADPAAHRLHRAAVPAGISAARAEVMANPKLQIPSSNHSQRPNPKLAIASGQALGFGRWEFLWDLGVGSGWDLELGAWDLTPVAQL